MGKPLALVAALLAPLAFAPPAEAFVYWTTDNPEVTIGRAKLNGKAVENGFISDLGRTPSSRLNALAVDDTYVYWAGLYAIGRANLNGTGVNRSFIRTGGRPFWVTVGPGGG